jgi:hypothetical protein
MTTTGPAHVWVITDGEPDGYAVLQAFPTEQAARSYAEQLPGGPHEILVAKIQLPTPGRFGPQAEDPHN